MCGINGFTWKDPELIERMNSAIRHRGPDDSGIFVDDRVSLGNVRLAILDLSPKGHQPMRYERGEKVLWIVYNGEVYNYEKLREVLVRKGYNFTSGTDTEVVVASYMEWGERCVEKFNGMWAFAIYDPGRRRIFLSRDRLGIKPLHYLLKEGRLIFSSEIKGILQHPIKREVDEEVLFDYLYYNLEDHTERTFFKGIKRLPPGHNAIFHLKRGELHIARYFQLKAGEGIKGEVEGFKEVFRRAVKRRMRADVPVGSCLSGGIDSSSIACTMRSLLSEGEIEAFSLIFPGKDIDESSYQKKVVVRCRLKWNTTTFTMEEILEDLDDLIYTQEEPFQTFSIYAQYRLMKLARERGIKVLLDGQGADEILGGYHYFFSFYLAELFRGLKWGRFIREVRAYKRVHGKYPPRENFILSLLPKPLVRRLWRRNFLYLKEDFIRRHEGRRSRDPIWEAKSFKEASTISETYLMLPQLLRFEDRNSMRWSVESRVPFCDHELVEYTLSLPTEEIIGSGETKRVLRRAMKGILPESVRLRRDKIGFATPDKDLLRTEEGRWFAEEIIGSESFRKRPYWDQKVLEGLLKEHISGKKNHAGVLWKCIIVELWLRRFIDGQ